MSHTPQKNKKCNCSLLDPSHILNQGVASCWHARARAHTHTHKHARLSYSQDPAQRAMCSGPRPALPAQQGPRRSCHTLPPHHPPISARTRYRRAHCTTHATTPSSSRFASPNNIHTKSCTCLYTHAGFFIYTYADTIMYICMYSIFLSPSLAFSSSFSFPVPFCFCVPVSLSLSLVLLLSLHLPLFSSPFMCLFSSVFLSSLPLLFSLFLSVFHPHPQPHTQISIHIYDPHTHMCIHIHRCKCI